MVGEPEPSLGVEDQIIGCSQRMAVALGVEDLDIARVEIDAFDASPAVILRQRSRQAEAGEPRANAPPASNGICRKARRFIAETLP